jgi:hypothetical protein
MAERISTGLRNEILKSSGKSMADALADGIIDIYSGSQPATADAVETGTLLARITLASGAFTPGVATNGINLDEAAAGAVAKAAAEVWSGVGLDDGTAGWFRFYDNAVDDGASTTAIRMDGAIATSGAEINMSNTSIVTSGTVTIDGFVVTLPAA